ncbi:MAG: hypothetical protein AB7G23_20105 [Vicinamibacterales bacterium]
MGVFSRFRADGELDADPLGIQAAVQAVTEERARLADAQRRIVKLGEQLTPRARQQAMDQAAQTGRVEDVLAARKADADAETELEVLQRFIPGQQSRIAAAQEELNRLKVRRLQVGQALQIAALNEALPGLLAAIDQVRAAAAPFADWSKHDLWGGETNPLLVRLHELQRYLTGNEPGDWSTMVAIAGRALDSETDAVAIAMSQPERASRPAASHGLF